MQIKQAIQCFFGYHEIIPAKLKRRGEVLGVTHCIHCKAVVFVEVGDF